jgi:flagellar basal body-associated protein FliL
MEGNTTSSGMKTGAKVALVAVTLILIATAFTVGFMMGKKKGTAPKKTTTTSNTGSGTDNGGTSTGS